MILGVPSEKSQPRLNIQSNAFDGPDQAFITAPAILVTARDDIVPCDDALRGMACFSIVRAPVRV